MEIITRLRRQSNDDSHAEAKAAARDLGKSLWDTVSAFANTDGEIVILGLDQKAGFTPATGFDPNATLDALDNHLLGERAKVEPTPRVAFDRVPFESSELVVLFIESMRSDPILSERMPCFVRDKGITNGSFKRVADKDKRLSPYEIHELQSRTRPDNSDIEIVEGTGIGSLDPSAISAVLERLHRTRSRIGEDGAGETEILMRLKALSRGGEATLAGILSLGRYPQEYFPQLFIDVTVHPGVEKSSDPRIRFSDRYECDGRLPDAIDTAVKAVVANLKIRQVERGARVVTEPEIPEMVIREAITNAVMHRDYSYLQQGQQVAVDVYPDRVEIQNPGGLWGDRTLDNIGDGTSVSRNKALAKLLSHTPIASDGGTVAENAGSGMPRMRAGMAMWALPVPQFRPGIGSFTVILARFGLLTPETQEWLDRHGHSRTRETDLILVLAKEYGKVTPQMIRGNLGIDTDDAREALAELLAEGHIVVVPHTAETFSLPSELTGAERAIMSILSSDSPKNISQIEKETGKSRTALRPLLRALVESGHVVATAPPQSRLRAYLRAPEP